MGAVGQGSLKAFQAIKKNASDALSRGDKTLAWGYQKKVIEYLIAHFDDTEYRKHIISESLEFSELCFILGQGFNELLMFLEKGLSISEETGDRRSRALINLHLGRLYYFTEKLSLALESLARGAAEVEELGDLDILTRASEFLGLLYFARGELKEAKIHFERAAKSYESGNYGPLVHSNGPLGLCICLAYLGLFHSAIGTIDYFRRLAADRADHSMATTLKATQAYILLTIHKFDEANYHLSSALEEAYETRNNLAIYFTLGAIAYQHFLKGRLEDAREWLIKAINEGALSGLVMFRYASPIFLEMMFGLEREKIAPVPYLDYHEERYRVILEPNIHLRGVALRLAAIEAEAGGSDITVIESDLKSSEDYLKKAGDVIQLGHTRLAIVRLLLLSGETEEARKTAQKAAKNFSGYADVFFPNDLQYLLSKEAPSESVDDSTRDLLELFGGMVQELTPDTEIKTLLSQVTAATNRFFGAERGGIFWFRRREPAAEPELRAACNLSQKDITHPSFRPSLELINKSFQENRPIVFHHKTNSDVINQIKAILCVPFSVGNDVQGVLYHDNSYVHDCFTILNNSQLVEAAQALTGYVEHITAFTLNMDEIASESIKNLSSKTSPDDIVAESEVMSRLLAKADKIADTDSNILILGETGVGKELLAGRIHMNSPRKDRPLVVIDPTAIPETLIESELFGHEKGAFTGADRQKVGRIELAHKGTLFIDEVGEMTRAMQVKLLRVLQEKTFLRIGGTLPIVSEFRLIAATNRDLAREVAAGRFREDLYFRLNVIPFTIPPLRDRPEDIPLLAEYFLSMFTAKYGCSTLTLKPEQKRMLCSQKWPGNIRELRNEIERVVLLSKGGGLEFSRPLDEKSFSQDPFADSPSLDELQKRYISYILTETNGKISGENGAAEILGMNYSTLYNRMKKLGLK